MLDVCLDVILLDNAVVDRDPQQITSPPLAMPQVRSLTAYRLSTHCFSHLGLNSIYVMSEKEVDPLDCLDLDVKLEIQN